ncbi:hypothetical protein HRI_003777600 [Hibiscus trionum]|uniref:CW-type domain-containing protein n=1 Tax=Hibiscus trionum TaxID=183268 RepID=A0A9W7ITN3_HIBTR|nr:hypothetical protein HRI_003777600 [Hibiscus trionum]
MKLPSSEKRMSSGGKRKSKDSQRYNRLAAEVPKESLRLGSSSMLNHKQSANANRNTNKREPEGQKIEGAFRKAEDRYRDFFGDVGESFQEENPTSSKEICSNDRLKEADYTEKSTPSINTAHSDRLSGKKIEDLLATESYPRATVDGSSNTTNVNVARTSHTTAAPLLIKENWVCCDKCQKWRLLPININPSDLPEKWLCSMLNWMPGMNHCSIEEEETTKAVFALYQVPSIENQSSPGNVMSRLPSDDALKPEQNQQSFESHAMPPAGRKKHGLKEISNAMDKDGPTPMKNNLQSSVRSRSLSDRTQSPVVDEPGLHHLSKRDLPVEKKKNKHKLLEHSYDGGDAKTSKMKAKRTADQGSVRPSKKIKGESLHFADEDYMSEHGGKVGPSTSNGLPTTSGEKDHPRKGQDQEAQCKSTIMDEEHQNDNCGNANVSRPRKSGKGSSRSKDRTRNFKSDSVGTQQDYVPSYEVKSRVGRNKFQERPGVKSDESENGYFDDKDSLGKLSGKSSQRESQPNFGQSYAKLDATGGQDVISTVKQNLVQGGNSEKYTMMFHSDKSDHAEIASGRGNSLPLLPPGGTKNEMLTRSPRPVSGSQTGNGADESQDDDALKVQKQITKADQRNGAQHSSSKHTSGGCRIKDVDAPSPMRKDFSSQAATITNALKEAKDLKHLADRIKNSGSNVESTALYFQAALKFLHSASLLESFNGDTAKHGEMIQSMQIYSSTAKLCEFCAHGYERLKDMAAASLAYKCMEVAYMRVIYSSHASANRDRHEFQTALQMVPPGESASSASDVDNLNHPDKVAFPKGVSSPQVAGNHVISARNRPNFVRLLNFAQDINNAMEASRKSRTTFAAANSSSRGTEGGEAISSVKKALDFNFLDVEGVLRLVRVAIEAISH